MTSAYDRLSTKRHAGRRNDAFARAVGVGIRGCRRTTPVMQQGNAGDRAGYATRFSATIGRCLRPVWLAIAISADRTIKLRFRPTVR